METFESPEYQLTALQSLLDNVNLSPKHRKQVETNMKLIRAGVKMTLKKATEGVVPFSK